MSTHPPPEMENIENIPLLKANKPCYKTFECACEKKAGKLN